MRLAHLKYRWLLAVTLGFTETVSWGVLYYAFGVVIAPMQAELGWSRGQISTGFSLGLVVLGLTGIPVGAWLERHGPRLLMTAGSILGVLLLIGWSRVGDLATFYALFLLMGGCWAATLSAPAFATITAHFRDRWVEALTVVALMAGLASTIFLPLTAWLVTALGWRAALVVLGGILAATTILPHALVLRPAPAEPSDRDQYGSSLYEALRHPSFRWLALAFFCTALGTGIRVHLVPYLLERGYALGSAAFIAGLVGASEVIGRLVLLSVERRVPAAALIGGVYASQPLALAILLLLSATIAPYMFVVLFGVGRGADTLIRNTVVARLYGVRRFASIQGVLWLFITVAWAIGPVGLGAIYDRFGDYEIGFWLMFAASSVATLAILIAVAGIHPQIHLRQTAEVDLAPSGRADPPA